MIRIQRYMAKNAPAWNRFVAESKNATFLHDRNYMDYHADRFADHSLLVFEDETLLALLPANREGGALHSHQGLTYGGFLTGRAMRASLMLEVFGALKEYLTAENISALHYKPVPAIYHSYPAEEDIYALFRMEARLVRVDVAASIPLERPWPLHHGKKTGAAQARKAGVGVRASEDYEAFFDIASTCLAERHDARPVHSAQEMRLLASRFPENIRLHGAYREGRMVAGTIMYLTHRVAHAQYIASTPEGRDTRAVDLMMAQMIAQASGHFAWFDFGISTEAQGRVLNTGLSAQKEEFGARGIVHTAYSLYLN